MEIPSQEAEMPIPLNSTYGGGHAHGHHHGHHTHVNMMHHHHHDPPQIIPPSGPAPISSTLDNNAADDDDHDDDVHAHTHINTNHHVAAAIVPFKKPVKYKECLKNHAASMGGTATDGCGEFMPSGDDGTLEALTCSACNCHRNFHRKEADDMPTDINTNTTNNSRMGRKMYLGHRYLGQDNMGYHHHVPPRGHHYGAAAPPPPHHHQLHPHPMIMSYNNMSLQSESEEMEGNGTTAGRPAKKRFRTKFSQEQKEKMMRFAERVGWKMQKQEEGVVEQFCQEVGVKRRVLKVWMHNNKHNLANKTLTLTQTQTHHPNINISGQNHL